MTSILQTLCSVPTAPFVETHVTAYVGRFVRARKKLRLTRDRTGNLLITLPGASRGPRWVFMAHMDHPGLVAGEMNGPRSLSARFHGGVLGEYLPGTRVRFFDAGREITGRIVEVTESDADRPAYPARVSVRVTSPVAPGSAGMFDVGAGRTRGKKFYSRVCDNLAGAAAALTMLDRLHRVKKPPAVDVAVMFTRAEEEGFIGAIAAVSKPELLRKTDRLVVIECSAAQPYAPQGDGCVIRVGDRTSIFHSALTYFITQQAEDLAKTDPTFKFQRALMPGGTCEATVYDAFGYVASSVCVPLGNYHNMDKVKKKIAAEFIDLNDWQGMVKLFVHLAQNGAGFSGENVALKKKLIDLFEKFKPLL